MARIAGVDLPREKRVEIGLTYIYGIGRPTALAILEKAGIACHTLQLKTPQRRAANEREGNQNGNPTDRGTDPAAD